MTKKKVSIVILNHKSDEHTLSCVKSIPGKNKHEIIVVDNGGSGNLKTKLQKISKNISFFQTKNNGYGAGNNYGIKKSHGKYILILNPDTLLKKDSITNLEKVLDDEENVAAVGPNLVDEKGVLQQYIGSDKLTPFVGIFSLGFLHKLFPNNKIARKYWLKDVSKEKVREVASIPGSAFMIRRNVFDLIGGFDENIFMYFEEADIGKKLINAGYRLLITPESVVTHKWHSVKEKSQFLNDIFQRSRFYYFKKYYGFFNACLVETFCRFSKHEAVFLSILAIGIFLRFFRLMENFSFHGELGHVYVELKNYMIDGKIPLAGPQTSHPWMRFGPLYYWILYPIFLITNFNPFTPTIFMAFASTSTIILNYYYVSKWISKRAALLSSFIIATSFSFLQISRGSMLFSLVVFVFYPFLDYFLKSLNSKKYVFWVFLFFGVMLNFHLSAIILIPGMMLCYLILGYFKKVNFWKQAVTGMLIPNFALLIYDAQNGFSLLKNFTLWIPYRIAGFFGLYPKNNIDSDIALSNLQSFYDFVSNVFTTRNIVLSFIFLPLLIGGIFYLLKQNLEVKYKKLTFVLVIFLITGYISIFIHGDPPNHYFLPLFPLPIIILGLLYEVVSGKIKKNLLLFILFASAINFKYYFSPNWLFNSSDKIDRGHIPYLLQVRSSKAIYYDSMGLPYALARKGVGDEFDGNFAENYQFLLWRLGNEPVQVGDLKTKSSGISVAKYTISEDEPVDEGVLIFDQGGIKVYKDASPQRL